MLNFVISSPFSTLRARMFVYSYKHQKWKTTVCLAKQSNSCVREAWKHIVRQERTLRSIFSRDKIGREPNANHSDGMGMNDYVG